jgi:hypothetical protein
VRKSRNSSYMTRPTAPRVAPAAWRPASGATVRSAASLVADFGDGTVKIA